MEVFKVKIAAVIDNEEKIVPIVEGVEIRIYNTETSEYIDYPNLALELDEGRRGATLNFADSKGATVFVAPPETFCELSYDKARKEQFKFYHLDSKVPFKQFAQKLVKGEIKLQETLPKPEIVPSN